MLKLRTIKTPFLHLASYRLLAVHGVYMVRITPTSSPGHSTVVVKASSIC